MAQIPYRANLSATVFPMTIAKAGRSVINPGADQNYDKRVDPASSMGSVGIPQVIYMENVLPTVEGFQSVVAAETGTIDTSDASIRCIETIRLAVNVSETTVTDDIAYTDDCSSLDGWTVCSAIGGANSRSVTIDNVIGDPLPSIKIAYDENGGIPAFLYRALAHLGECDSMTAVHTFTYNDACKNNFRFLTTAGGAGLCAAVNYGLGGTGDWTLGLAIGAGWGDAGGVPLIFTAFTGTPLISGTFYELVVALVKNVDSTYTVSTTLNDLAGPSVIASVNWSGALSVKGDYIGWVAEASYDSATTNAVWIDNIDITAAIPDISYLTVSGVSNLDIAFFADDSATCSHGNLDDWEDLPVNLPVDFVSPLGSDNFSTAYVRGECYFCIKEDDGTTKIYHASYNGGTDELDVTDVSATIAVGLGPAFTFDSIVSIVGSYNYLILLTADAVFWSSTTTPTDFSASLVSGAGNERIGNLKGDISFAREHVAGFILYTNGNAIMSQYTGNARYPWKFVEIGGSAGYSYSTQVAGDTNTPMQLGVSNARTIQSIEPNGAELIAQEVSNFLERTKGWDRFNYATKVFTIVREGYGHDQYLLNRDNKYRIWYGLDRYIIVGYDYEASEQYYRSALVFDILLKRYGKINTLFHQILINEYSIYFIDFSGGASIGIKKKLFFDLSGVTINSEGPEFLGVLVLGKFQLTRERFLTLDEVELECGAIQSILSGNLSCTVLPTLDGKTFVTPVTLVEIEGRNEGAILEYKSRIACQNFCLCIQGAFDINTVALKAHQNGRR